MGDFNLKSANNVLKCFMDINGFINLIKIKSCFKGQRSCIGLILTNRKYCFTSSSSYKTGESDPHHLVCTMLKSAFSKTEPKFVPHRNFKNFQFDVLKSDLNNAIRRFLHPF